MVLILLLLSFAGKNNAQQVDETTRLLIKLDSISNSSSMSRHFAAIYFETTIGAVNFFSTADKRVQELIERLELRFADYFFKSVNAYRNNEPIPEVWKTYYADSNASSLRCILHGINAHINGDIWQALTTEFSVDEIKELKPHYFTYYKGLLKDYKKIYNAALESDKKMRTIHAASLGLDKWYGKLLLARWRKRQINLAELYFLDKEKFEKRLEKLKQKKNRLDDIIRRKI